MNGLLPGVQDKLNDESAFREQLREVAIVPPSLPSIGRGLNFIETVQQAEDMLIALQSLAIRAISMDSEFSFSRGGLELRSGKIWNDIRSQRPIVISISAWAEERGNAEKGYVLNYVIDVRKKELLPFLQKLLGLRVKWIFHHLKSELFTLWALGLNPSFHNFCDTFVAAAAIHLGIHHPRGWIWSNSEDESDLEEIEIAQKAEEKRDHLLSLVGQCAAYGILHPFGRDKEDLRRAFLELGPVEPISQRLREYAASDAIYTLLLYVAQSQEIFRLGLDYHLNSIEFPFTVTNARMEWTGVLLDASKMKQIVSACSQAAEHYESVLKSSGMENPNSRHDFIRLMSEKRLLHLFTERTPTGDPCVKDAILETLENVDPVIRAYRMANKYKRMANSEWLTGIFVGTDGRVHPNHRQLGAHTGRNTCSNPNLIGIGKIFRPIVIATAGKAILEFDFAQIEVGIAGAEYGDPDLISAYNRGDVYAFMAQQFYKDILSDEERAMHPLTFKKARHELREKMKTFVLCILYNGQAPIIKATFGISLSEAKRQRKKFLSLFPTIKKALEESSIFGTYRRYACTVTGLRRHIEDPVYTSSWAKNFLRNTPIQGSAAIVFKLAMNLLDREFAGTDILLILGIYDATVIECPKEKIDYVSSRADTLMSHALRSFYPALSPRVTPNVVDTSCWNKDGHSDSIERFLKDPTFKL